jgi:transcription termination factor Rho
LQKIKGYLEFFPKGFGFIRTNKTNLQALNTDVYVSRSQIKEYGLREGAYLEAESEMIDGKGNKKNSVNRILQINNLSPASWKAVKSIKDQTSINPEDQINLDIGGKNITGKILNLITPLGKGQRGLIVSPPKAGKTTVLKNIAKAVEKNHPEIKVFVLLVDERPEEVTDFKKELQYSTIFSSSSDEENESHLRISKMVMNMAMRVAETGKDALVLIDSLTRMGRAFNKDSENNGKTLSGGLGANALELPRRFFGSARNIEKGGSLTIMATILVDTGSRMDEVIFQEFKGTGNLDLVLSRKCAEQRVFPAIKIGCSGTRKEELLLDDDELKRVHKIRRQLYGKDEMQSMRGVLELFRNE